MQRKKKSFGRELLVKAREAALCAIRVYNDPHVSFKSETYSVLMIIAWTYLLHAHYRKARIEYRYFTQRTRRKVFHRTKLGAYKYWELERCIDCDDCPLDANTKLNLRFSIQLRHEIEHQMTQSLDGYLSGRYQACALNFNRDIKKFFGESWGLDDCMAYSIQFVQLSDRRVDGHQAEPHLHLDLFNVTLVIEDFDFMRAADRLTFDLLGDRRASGAG